VVSAGINDFVGHFGASHYAANLGLIAESLKARGCTPLIIDLPRVDRPAYERQSAVSLRLRADLYAVLFDRHEDVDEYRAQAHAVVKASFFDPDREIATPRGKPALWANPNHLTHEGYDRLGRALADAIVADAH
jgi:lysophospholipase L1-like esterase